MWFIEFLFLIIGGVLVIPDIITKNLPKSSDILKTVTPYQPWFGLILLIWGICDLISSLFLSGRVFFFGFLSGILLLAVILIEICLGIILSMNFLKNIKEIHAEELQKLEKMLIKYQSALGISGIIAGIYIILRFTVLMGVRF